MIHKITDQRLISPDDLGERDYLVICADGDSTLVPSRLAGGCGGHGPNLVQSYVPFGHTTIRLGCKTRQFQRENVSRYVIDPPFMRLSCSPRAGGSSIHPSPAAPCKDRFRTL